MAIDGVVADTDVVIDFLRGSGEGVAVVEDLLRTGRCLVSAITAYELAAGALSQTEQTAVAAFCTPRTLAFSRRTAEEAGRLARVLRERGTPIGVADTLIAGLCLERGAALATRNQRHFSRVPGLTLHPVD
ncbi:type II toxin-antitoxin system VapC family toxin [soil metagenome]